MFKKLLTIAFVATIFASSGLVNTVSAQAAVTATEPIGICTFIKPICDAFGLNGQITVQSAFDYMRDRANVLLSVLFVGIILLSVFIIVQAGIKYIQSQGEEKQIAEAQKAIKTVFIGIGVLFVGIAGLVLVLAFFGGLGLLNSNTSVNDIICPESQQGASGDCVVQ